jgi:peptidoglycan/LPS O-acetylase OafA/YrhL
MQFYSVWPIFIIVATVLALVYTPVFAAADTPPNPHGSRLSGLDGLRGFLALGVFFHHASIYHGYLLGLPWTAPPSRFYLLLGQVSVAMFFMITGFLFWGKVIAARGRPNWAKLYIGRIFRIGPLYAFAVGTMIVIVAQRTHFALHVPGRDLLIELFRWSTLGWSGNGPDINGYKETAVLLAGVVWTLSLEWKFYLSLLMTSLAARRAWSHLPFAVCCLAMLMCYAALHDPHHLSPAVVRFSMLFCMGMTCASLQAMSLTPRLPDTLASICVVGLLCILFWRYPNTDSLGSVIVIGLTFLMVCCDASVFGLLSNRSAHRLGNLSYCIYLLHGLVFALVFSLDMARSVASSSPAGYWAIVAICAVILLFFSTFAHVVVERPGIDLGRRVCVAVDAFRGRRRLGIIPTAYGIGSK